MTDRDPYDIAIDQILQAADGDVRLALRTVLIQNVQLETKVLALSAQISPHDGQPLKREELN
jgi:hypothetical protein